MISLLWPFFYSCIHCLFFLFNFREYFGNQAGLTNCSGTLIWLADSTASAPPVRKNKGSFQRVSFQYYSHELSPLSVNFPLHFQLIFSGFLLCLTFFIELFSELSKLYSFIIRLFYSFIYSFILFVYSSLFLCLTF